MGERSAIGPNLVKDTSENVDLIRKRLLTAQSRQKRYADKQRRPLEFEVGDHVFLKVMPKRGVTACPTQPGCRTWTKGRSPHYFLFFIF